MEGETKGVRCPGCLQAAAKALGKYEAPEGKDDSRALARCAAGIALGWAAGLVSDEQFAELMHVPVELLPARHTEGE